MAERRKSISSKIASFATAASLLVSQQPALAQTANDHPLYITLPERIDTCFHADYNQMVDTHDVVGLHVWLDDCADAIRNKVRRAEAVPLWAIARIELAKYYHDYPRKSPWIEKGLEDGIVLQASEESDPAILLKAVRETLKAGQDEGSDVSKLYPMLDEAENYIHTTPSSFPRQDPSPGVSCLYDGMPSDPDEAIEKVNTCEAAYNERPLGLIAYYYSIAIINCVHNHRFEISDTSALRWLYTAKDFATRAKNEVSTLGNGEYGANYLLRFADEGIKHYKGRILKDKLMDAAPWIVAGFAVGVWAVGLSGIVAGETVAAGGASAEGTAAAGAAAEATRADIIFTFLQAQRAAIPLVP